MNKEFRDWLEEKKKESTYSYLNNGKLIKPIPDIENELELIIKMYDEFHKPVIVPQFVADEFDYDKKPYWEVDESKDVSHILECAFSNEAKPSDFLDWVRENPEDYVMAVRNGYEVKEEPLYYALIKGHELLADEDAWYCNYLNLSVSDGRVFPSDKSSADGSFSTEMTKSEWSEIGINDSNADFVKVKEVEEK